MKDGRLPELILIQITIELTKSPESATEVFKSPKEHFLVFLIKKNINIQGNLYYHRLTIEIVMGHQ